MNLSAAIYAIRWLVRDTFRQARASGISWVMFAVSGVCILFCLSVRVNAPLSLKHGDEPPEFLSRNDAHADPAKLARQGVDVAGGDMTVAFGAVRLPLARDGRDGVRFLQLVLAGGVADALGVLLALVWTAGFLPTFLEPSAASVLLAKPAPRWSLLAGKYLGVLAFVGFQALLFVGGTWLALGLRTGVWDMAYLWCVPLLLLHFGVFFSFSALLAVCTRSTVTCVIGSLLFWLLCWGMNYGRHLVTGLPDGQQVPGSLGWLVEGGYWALPKPADLGLILFDGLDAGHHFAKGLALQNVEAQGQFHPGLSILSSLLFAAVMLYIAGRQLVTTDY
jgi:ABC-type transport system involved in multi-copper enzyme maturation permease subunit